MPGGQMVIGVAKPNLLEKFASIPKGYKMFLDAGNPDSYPGTGTTWYDLSDNSYDWIVRQSDYSTNDGGTFIFNDGGIAVRSTDIPLNYAGTTMVVALKWRSGGTDWRTLVRGNSADHHVMVQNSTTNLGFYDNNGANFLDSGYNIDDFTNWDTKYNIWVWQYTNTGSPYYRAWANGQYLAQITNASSAINNGFRCIGGYHAGQVNAGVTSQQAGDIGAFILYDRILNDREIKQCYFYYKDRFGI